jgi:hypothetical protein
MRPSQYAARSDPGVIHKCFVWAEVDKRKLTRSLVGFCVVVISRFSDIAIPIPSSAVGPDAEFLVQRQLRSGVKRGIDKIQAPVSWKFDLYYFFDLPIDSVYASDFLVPSHDWPFLLQLNTAGVFHDDVFATNGG